MDPLVVAGVPEKIATGGDRVRRDIENLHERLSAIYTHMNSVLDPILVPVQDVTSSETPPREKNILARSPVFQWLVEQVEDANRICDLIEALLDRVDI